MPTESWPDTTAARTKSEIDMRSKAENIAQQFMTAQRSDLHAPRVRGEQTTSGKKRDTEDSFVKSAARVLELIEFLAETPRGATLTDVSRGLNIPQSSTTALLRTLKTLGYVGYRRHGRTYYLTARATLLGAQASLHIFGDGQLFAMMRELTEETGAVAILAIRHDLAVRLVQVVQSAKLEVRVRGIRPLIKSISGRLFLAALPVSEMRSIVRRMNSEIADAADRVNLKPFEEELEIIRRQGFIFSCQTTVEGVAGLAVRVPTLREEDLMAIVLAGPIDQMRTNQEAYLSAIHKAFKRHRRNGLFTDARSTSFR